MVIDTGINSDLAIPPGEFLAEVIADIGMTKDDLARRMARPASKLSAIFGGDKAITPDTALQLEKVLGVPAHLWLGLESEYRLTLARQQSKAEEERLKVESRLVTGYCYSQLAKLGIVAKTRKPLDKVRELHRFFGVASLEVIPEVRRYEPAFRQGVAGKQRRSPEALTAWLRLGEVRAMELPCSSFDSTLLHESLGSIRSLTIREPAGFLPELTQILADAGVALAIIPHFPGTRAHGATFRLGKDKAALVMTIRGSWADVFWFSLFHELGHILLHDRYTVILEDDDGDPSLAHREAEADRFACETLIPPADYRRFLAVGDFMPPAIAAFAEAAGIDAGIVVGRLQHDGRLKHEWHNTLRTRYVWSEEVA